MQYIYGTADIELLKESVVILGNFDGIHLGHQKLFNVAKGLADKKGLQTVVFSFYPHPTWVLGNTPKSLLMSRIEKKNKIEKLGMDVYVEYPFTQELAKLSAESFIVDILLEKLNCKVVVVGNNYFFGDNKEGNTTYLKEMGDKYSFEVYALQEIRKNGAIVCSTFIRELILNGEIEAATRLLGHPYQVRGTVLHGKKLGRTLGFPTINIMPDVVKVLPPNGVYISTIYILDKKYYGLTNVGYNPTVDGKMKVIETYIFDFYQQVYGEEVVIEFIKYIRPEYKFKSLDELVNQMNKDKEYAQKYIEF